ncbi:MAG: hypothetical protein IKJ33_05455 [Clostridia bacterium]|nr:hypothetical protein [Clostridia bacterium]
MKRLSFKSSMLRIMALALSLIFVFVVSKLNFGDLDDMKHIYSSFIGQKSPYNGVVEIWNIDSFESGTKSKQSFLENLAKRFQKQNKGVYVLVRNLTFSECENSLEQGKTPDLISCSYGVCEKIKDYFVPFENKEIGAYDNFVEAGKCGDEVYGLAWCVGFYCLISTKAKIERAKIEFENVKLNEIAYKSGYKYKVGKKEKESKSLIYGVGDYLMPKNALKAYNKSRSIQIEENETEELKLKSQYSAYSSFLSNNATILLGTHRDIFRMMNREEKGNVCDVSYLPLLEWTDLVQFSFLCKNDDKNRKMMAEKFAKFLTLKENQEMLDDIGMFPVAGVDEFDLKGVMSHITLDKFSDCKLKRVF